MENVVTTVQIVIGLILTGLILLQAKGTGLGKAGSGIAYHSRRGVEKLVFRLTVILTVVFVCVSLAEYFV